MHKISEIQNQHIQIQRLRAQRRLYDEVRRRKWIRIWGVVFLNGIWVVCATFMLQNNFLLVAGSGLIAMIEFWVEKSWQESVHRKAVLVQERFDCDVLKLEWNDNINESPPLANFIVHWSDKYDEEKYRDYPLSDWYCKKTDLIPLEYARLCCQFSNIDWDESLRIKYIKRFVIVALAVVAAVALLIVVSGTQQVAKYWFLGACLLPLTRILWIETTKNFESISNLKSIRGKIEAKWHDALTGQLSVSVLEKAANDWQKKIFDHRLLSPVLPRSLYSHSRPKQEKLMNRSCEALVEEVLRALKQKKDGNQR